MTASLLIGCGSAGGNTNTNEGAAEQAPAAAEENGEESAAPAAASNEELSGTLTFAIWDNNLNDFIEENDMVGKFHEQYPNVDV